MTYKNSVSVFFSKNLFYEICLCTQTLIRKNNYPLAVSIIEQLSTTESQNVSQKSLFTYAKMPTATWKNGFYGMFKVLKNICYSKNKLKTITKYLA